MIRIGKGLYSRLVPTVLSTVAGVYRRWNIQVHFGGDDQMIAYPKFFVSIFTRSFIGEDKEIKRLFTKFYANTFKRSIEWYNIITFSISINNGALTAYNALELNVQIIACFCM